MTIKEAGDFAKQHGYTNQVEGDIFWFENKEKNKMIVLKAEGEILNINLDSKCIGFTASAYVLDGHTYVHDPKALKYYKIDYLKKYFLEYPNFYY
jgi:hypothetical protein